MLVVVGVDANDPLFPLAFAIVEGENNGSWGWFMVVGVTCFTAQSVQAG